MSPDDLVLPPETVPRGDKDDEQVRSATNGSALPRAFSVSQLTTFLMCPRKYWFRYVARRTPEHRSASLAFGSAVHSAVEWWHRERMAGRSPRIDMVQRIFRADWTAQLAAGDLLPDERDPKELMATGEVLLTLFVERFKDEVPDGAEVRFEVPLTHPKTGARHPLPLVGVLDSTRGTTVTELKTAGKKTDPSNYAMQLSAYSYATRLLNGESPKLRLVELITTKVPKMEIIDVQPEDVDEEWFQEVAFEAMQAIAAGTSFPLPSWACPKCEYRRACGGG